MNWTLETHNFFLQRKALHSMEDANKTLISRNFLVLKAIKAWYWIHKLFSSNWKEKNNIKKKCKRLIWRFFSKKSYYSLYDSLGPWKKPRKCSLYMNLRSCMTEKLKSPSWPGILSQTFGYTVLVRRALSKPRGENHSSVLSEWSKRK